MSCMILAHIMDVSMSNGPHSTVCFYVCVGGNTDIDGLEYNLCRSDHYQQNRIYHNNS